MSTMYNLLHIPLCTVMLILIFNSTAYCHAHSFTFYILFFISYFSFILSYVYFPCVVFSIFALSMERTRLSFHCWLYSLCIVVYVTNKTWNLKLETWNLEILRGGESRSVAGGRVKHILRPLWMQWLQRGSAEQRVRKQQAEKRESCDHCVGGRGSQGTKESEHQESGRTWRDYQPCSEVMRWSACWFVHLNL